ncbi:putative short chain dehydrogenase/reductase [Macrophomina phaseolina]|uniref:Short chain dehydrogenase/reductase n=1 Tax=Macrophomina phaseolina TaxID=35725 RepID=A0ABQ8FR94_9PEZI|nr:putative short chain dehydrogenase/reductase [Macrophomina phaseolina]
MSLAYARCSCILKGTRGWSEYSSTPSTMADASKRLVLITGANSGVGFGLAEALMAKGSYHVLAGARSPEKGNAAVEELQSRNLPGSVELLLIDVADDISIESAAAEVERRHGKLDMLVNNAAIATVEAPLRQKLQECFNTNATGPAVVTNAFGPLLRKSSASPRIVNISSGAGSIGRRLDPSSPIYKTQEVQYRASKAALNMITACQHVEYASDGIKVFAYDPGFTQSNLSSHNKAENGARTAAESVKPLIDVLEGKRDEEAGKFLHNTGIYPW